MPNDEQHDTFKGPEKQGEATMALSDKQRKIIEFIADFVSQHPYPPGVRQIQDGCDISSTSVVAYHLHLLEKEGYIERDREISRGVRLLKGVNGQPFIMPKSQVFLRHSSQVFLCHSSVDKPAVRELYQHLCDDGIDAWLDEEKLLPGQDWQQEISKAIRTSDAVIVCLSRNSITKSLSENLPKGPVFKAKTGFSDRL